MQKSAVRKGAKMTVAAILRGPLILGSSNPNINCLKSPQKTSSHPAPKFERQDGSDDPVVRRNGHTLHCDIRLPRHEFERTVLACKDLKGPDFSGSDDTTGSLSENLLVGTRHWPIGKTGRDFKG